MAVAKECIRILIEAGVEGGACRVGKNRPVDESNSSFIVVIARPIGGGSVSEAKPSRVSPPVIVMPPLAVRLPLPLKVPLPQVSEPLTMVFPEFVRVPPEMFKALLTREAFVRDNEPADRAMAAWLVRLFAESAAEEEWVTVMLAKLMTASSVAMGTRLASQLLGVFQSPPAEFVQVTVAAHGLPGLQLPVGASPGSACVWKPILESEAMNGTT
jgi:hypothetical protein